MKVEYQGKTFKVGRKAKWIVANKWGEVWSFDDKVAPHRLDTIWKGTQSAYVGMVSRAVLNLSGSFPLMKIKVTATLEQVGANENSL